MVDIVMDGENILVIAADTQTQTQTYKRVLGLGCLISSCEPMYHGKFLVLQQINCKYRSKVLNISLKDQASAINFLPHTYAMGFGAGF